MRVRAVCSLIAACGLTLLPGCEELPTGPPVVSTGTIRGFNLADWSAEGYAAATASAALDGICETGANMASVLVTAYQESARSNRIRRDDPRTPTEASIATILREASARGLRTALKLHVDVDDGTWRGRIEPGDPRAWFASYGEFVRSLAELAEREGVSIFVVGTELAGTLDHTSRWRHVIADVRARFSGQLVYAASWDEADQVEFWNDLDLIGVNTYFPVARRTDPGRLELLAGWQPWLSRLGRLHHQTGLPLLVTEIGYRSVDGAGLHPYRFTAGGTIDLAEQADLYWAALQALGEEPWIEGLWWWNWLASGQGGPHNRDFTPLGKDAELVVSGAWNGI